MDRLELLTDRAVRSAVGREIGREIEYHPSIASTQDRARERGLGPTLVVADHQTGGHGRGAKSWLSEPGGSLLASWVYEPAPVDAALFALLAGVAVARALGTLGVADLGLKWPNDVWLSDGKVAGCLAHAAEGRLVIGIGINVAGRDVPAELAGIATTLQRAGHDVDRLTLLARLTAALDRVADPADRVVALAEWRDRSITLGHQVEVRDSGVEAYQGSATGLADDGALLVETSYGQQRVLAGEVRVLG